jgi:hypothetical protein
VKYKVKEKEKNVESRKEEYKILSIIINRYNTREPKSPRMVHDFLAIADYWIIKKLRLVGGER